MINTVFFEEYYWVLCAWDKVKRCAHYFGYQFYIYLCLSACLAQGERSGATLSHARRVTQAGCAPRHPMTSSIVTHTHRYSSRPRLVCTKFRFKWNVKLTERKSSGFIVISPFCWLFSLSHLLTIVNEAATLYYIAIIQLTIEMFPVFTFTDYHIKLRSQI